MITKLSDFIAHKKLNENFDEIQAQDDVQAQDNIQAQDDVQAQDDNSFSIESLTASLDAEYDNMVANLEEGTEPPVKLTPEQIEMVFNVVSPMLAQADVQAQDDIQIQDEPLEEGLFSKPSPEAIQGAKDRIAEITNKFQGKTLTFMVKGDNKQIPFSEEAALNAAAKNGYKGVLKTVNQGDKVVVIYEPGATLLQKIAAGTTSNTLGK